MDFLRYFWSSLVMSLIVCTGAIAMINVFELFTRQSYFIPNLNALLLLGSMCVIASLVRALALVAEDYLS
jgi:hypothetical protein